MLDSITDVVHGVSVRILHQSLQFVAFPRRKVQLQILFYHPDESVETPQLTVQRRDLRCPLFLRAGQRGSDLFQFGADFGQLLGLRAKGFRHPLHLGGVVDRIVAVLMVPCLAEAFPGVCEGVVRFGSVSTGAVKGLRQLRDLKRLAGLQALVDRPRVATRRGDQLWFAQVHQRHGTAGRC